MDEHQYQSDFSSLDNELHHLSNPRDATAEDCLEEQDITNLNGETGVIDSDLPWYYQPQYSRFWQHYAAMQSWMQRYVIFYRDSFGQYPSVSYPQHISRFNPYPTYASNYPHPHVPFGRRRTIPMSSNWHSNSQSAPCQPYGYSPQSVRPLQRTQYRNRGSKKHEYVDNDTQNSTDESMEIEVSQEMLDFFKTSQKFREERDKGKLRAGKQTDKSKEKNFIRAEDKNDCRAPVEQPDEGRRKEMKVLYGKFSERIHSMETAMQMQFDRNCDRFQPAFWPILALKM